MGYATEKNKIDNRPVLTQVGDIMSRLNSTEPNTFSNPRHFK